MPISADARLARMALAKASRNIFLWGIPLNRWQAFARTFFPGVFWNLDCPLLQRTIGACGQRPSETSNDRWSSAELREPHRQRRRALSRVSPAELEGRGGRESRGVDALTSAGPAQAAAADSSCVAWRPALTYIPQTVP